MKAENFTEEGDLDRPFVPVIDLADLDNWFSYHPPRPGQSERYEALREQGKTFARLIFELSPPGADQMAAIRHVRDAVMSANVAIACEGEVQSAYYARKGAEIPK